MIEMIYVKLTNLFVDHQLKQCTKYDCGLTQDPS